jgi:thiamine-phosphate diphosphorylase
MNSRAILKNQADYTLYLVTDRSFISTRESLAAVIEQAILGGVTIVQLREKNVSTKEFVEIGRQILEITRKHSTPHIVNDRVDVALAIDAEGVHLGDDDMDPVTARKILGPSKIIGVTVNSAERAKSLTELNVVDYFGTEAVYVSNVKSYNEGPIGLEKLTQIVQATHLPGKYCLS